MSTTASPTKDQTPAADAKPVEKPLFTEKEERILKVAWLCLKTGPPEVDMKKLKELGEFNTDKTCSNTWGTIKKKLMSMAPPAADGEEGMASTPKTPKAKSTPKKRVAKEGGEGEDGSPMKKAKAGPKKGAETEEMEEGEVKEEVSFA